MEYSAVYEPDMQAFGILDVQLLTRYLEHQIPVEDLLKGCLLYTSDAADE